MPTQEKSRQARNNTQQKPRMPVKDIPDESKERHTEIAVEAGNKGREEMEKR